MNGKIVFLLEEPSMKGLIEAFIPTIFPEWIYGTNYLCIPHEGKSDLDKSIKRKLAAWKIEEDKFLIVRDNDNANPKEIEEYLKKLCLEAGKPNTKIQLVLQELEAWYLGDLDALSKSYNNKKINSPSNKKKYLNPESWQKPSNEVKKIVPSFQKVSGARIIGSNLNPKNNNANSFIKFINAIKELSTK